METVLHYIHDPLCGWCYAAQQLTDAVSSRAHGRFDIRLHAGGLFDRARLPEARRRLIRSADARIGALTGQVFGDAYLNGLLSDPETVYDSAVPIRGILAAEGLAPAAGLAMFKALQRAHYRDGLRIADAKTVGDVAAGIGLDGTQFAASFARVTDADLRKHLEETRALMHVVGARGYPTFVAHTGGRFLVLPHERFYDDPAGFADLVSGILVSR